MSTYISSNASIEVMRLTTALCLVISVIFVCMLTVQTFGGPMADVLTVDMPIVDGVHH